MNDRATREAPQAGWPLRRVEIQRTRESIEQFAVVERARGALMAAYALSAEDAVTAMQHEGHRERMPLHAVAERLLAQITGEQVAIVPEPFRPADRSPRSPGPG